MKTALLTVLLMAAALFAQQTYTISADIVGPIEAFAEFKFMLKGSDTYYASDSLSTKPVGRYVLAKTFTDTWVGTTYLKAVTKGYKIQAPNLFYDSLAYNGRNLKIGHIFNVIDTLAPSICYITVTPNIVNIKDTVKLTFIPVDNSGSVQYTKIEVSYDNGSTWILATTIPTGLRADTSSAPYKTVSTQTYKFIPALSGTCKFKITVNDSDVFNNKNYKTAYSGAFIVEPTVGVINRVPTKALTQETSSPFNIKGQKLCSLRPSYGIYVTKSTEGYKTTMLTPTKSIRQK